ncbi:MAG TPA: hypothetical protein VNA44_00480 [Burkholderiaceae bacterium]|nr:hypothetical protein [Burkholderiaceae bacterium]
MALSWKRAVNRGVLSGTCASILSTLALGACGRRESGSALAPVNAVSHWYWGDRALRVDRPSFKYTLPGYLTHHATSIFWAVLFEKTFGGVLRGRPAHTTVASAATAAVACFVDYQLTPKRLTPGFEHRLSKASLFVVYATFAVGLAVTEIARSNSVGGKR